MASKAKKFRVATEGATTDGRNIERSWIEQMAANYNPKKYGARVNLEHFKGLLPDGPFKRYGDVLELSAEKVEDGKLALFAVIDPTEDLVAMGKARQKVYTSIEVDPNFADTGEAYLVGLAVTDDPASLGCEMLEFSAKAKASPLAARKDKPENLFTAAIEFTLELEDDSASALSGFSEKIKAVIGKFSKRLSIDAGELSAAVETIAESQGELLEQFSGMPTAAEFKALGEKFGQLKADHDALVAKLSNEPAGPARTPATGGAAEHVTDC
ncbi:GPO family capsid scaffolding protein [Chromobacterium vaccinii]|uniref:GPO family capsid scaffolding protein n=1 Tax=Chromobacterium vaccinii TaxID=1108595 RepID=UPI000E19008A|nr:GPO family capsid scaffolding protein [Chromobacterium vaccinii]SUX53658.1 Phage capsid scaffolding protein (GPO) serine peptidase [Chromobacterium vaccinii]